MSTVTIFLAKALICFQGTCYPTLVGENTEVGKYEFRVLHTAQRGYGGTVLEYHRDHRGWFAIHQTFDNLPARTALYRASEDQRRYVSNGCPNVEPDVFKLLYDCCRHGTLEIKE